MRDRVGEHRPKLFATMDRTWGYHQPELAQASRILTAFSCFMGESQLIRVPRCLEGAVSYFQRVMASVMLIGLLYIACELYRDDVLVFEKDDEMFLKNLREVFDRFRKHYLKLKTKEMHDWYDRS